MTDERRKWKTKEEVLPIALEKWNDDKESETIVMIEGLILAIIITHNNFYEQISRMYQQAIPFPIGLANCTHGKNLSDPKESIYNHHLHSSQYYNVGL